MPPVLDPDRGVVVAVHGRGQDPAFIEAVVERLHLAGHAVLAPAAEGGSWYPEGFLAPIEENQPALDTALAQLEATVQRALDAGVPSERIVLLGFSQGACLVSKAVLTTPRRYAAVVVLTGGFIGPPGTAVPVPVGLAEVPFVFASHARDAWVPATRVLETVAVAAEAGARVSTLIEPGDAHEVTELAVRFVDHALASALTATS